MPRRVWKAPDSNVLNERLKDYPCPVECGSHKKLMELFGVATPNIDEEVRTGNGSVPLSKQMVNGPKMRKLIAEFLSRFGRSLNSGQIDKYPSIKSVLERSQAELMGYVLGAISDLCFNLEYVRRITDTRWSYCGKASDKRVYYPYLGVCPHCILQTQKPIDAVLGVRAEASEEVKAKARYFGNKIESHHVGRIGERVIVYILDLLMKSKFPNAKTLMIYDDQHDVDAFFSFENIGVLAQIKASPLVLLPVVSHLHAPLTQENDPDTGLPIFKSDHTFTDFAAAENELGLYIALTDTTIPIGPRALGDWPYEPFLSDLDDDRVLSIIENWIAIYESFSIPKRRRTGIDIKRAYLTSGWGAPIDDNKTKAGLARSDNMMKGAYACLKYGAYYAKECKRRSLRTALIANIDPAHQYEEYLEKLEDIRWGHDRDFERVVNGDGSVSLHVDVDKTTYLFDAVFTFNRQALNDEQLQSAWGLEDFISNLRSGSLDQLIQTWGVVS